MEGNTTGGFTYIMSEVKDVFYIETEAQSHCQREQHLRNDRQMELHGSLHSI